jgi:branched-chain amino acid transport system permease protein
MRLPITMSSDYRSRSTPVVLGLLVLLVAGSNFLIVSFQWESFLTTTLVYVVLTIGLYVFVGNSGVFSFGHMAFAAVGGYVAALLSIPTLSKHTLLPGLPGPLADLVLPWPVALLLGGVAAGVVALCLWSPMMRLSGLSGSLATAAFMLALRVVLKNWTPVTNGNAGLPAIPVQTTLDVAGFAAVVAIALAFAYQASRRGLLLRVAREDEYAAMASGVRIGRERLVALVLSAFITGCGGALLALMLGSVTPDTYYLHLTFLGIAMLVIGGINSLSGAVIGAVIVSVTLELLRQVELGISIGALEIAGRPGLSDLGLSILLVVVLWARSSGVMGTRELVLRSPFGPRRAGSSPSVDPPETRTAGTGNGEVAIAAKDGGPR